MNDTLRQDLYLIADELRGMAGLAKHFSKDAYETERAERMMGLATKIAALADDDHTADEIRAIFEGDSWLHVSPFIGVDTFVQNENGEVLLIQRADNHLWAMPGGLCEIGHTTAETALKELYEEAGLRGEVKRLLGIFDNRIWGTRAKAHGNALVYWVDVEDLNPVIGEECIAYAFFAENALPLEQMHPGHNSRVPACFAALRMDHAVFDAANANDIDLSDQQRPKG